MTFNVSDPARLAHLLDSQISTRFQGHTRIHAGFFQCRAADTNPGAPECATRFPSSGRRACIASKKREWPGEARVHDESLLGEESACNLRLASACRWVLFQKPGWFIRDGIGREPSWWTFGHGILKAKDSILVKNTSLPFLRELGTVLRDGRCRTSNFFVSCLGGDCAQPFEKWLMIPYFILNRKSSVLFNGRNPSLRFTLSRISCSSGGVNWGAGHGRASNVWRIFFCIFRCCPIVRSSSAFTSLKMLSLLFPTPFPFKYSAWAAKIFCFSLAANWMTSIWLASTSVSVMVFIFVFGCLH